MSLGQVQVEFGSSWVKVKFDEILYNSKQFIVPCQKNIEEIFFSDQSLLSRSHECSINPGKLFESRLNYCSAEMSHQTWIYDPEKKSSSGEKVKLWSFTPLEFKGSIHLLPTWMLKILWIFYDSHIIPKKVGNLSLLLKGFWEKMHRYLFNFKSNQTCHFQKEL